MRVEAANLKAIIPGNLLCKYADDTYIVIPASNSHTQTIELELNSTTWQLIVLKQWRSFYADKKSNRTAIPPLPLPDITRCTTLKILGVTVTNGVSMVERIHGVISSCSQTLHALKSPPCPRHARLCSPRRFRAVVIAKLCYASSAWWGFSTAGDNQRVTAFIRRSIYAKAIAVRTLPTSRAL